MAVDPDFPPYSKTQKPILSPKRPNAVYTILLLALLCLTSYFLGTWHHNVRRLAADNKLVEFPCTTNIAAGRTSPALDFGTHHVADDVELRTTETSSSYPPCDGGYSEYTPCEDPTRSVKFKRERLIYRERHCPNKSEALKCRIPAPHGYKNPFPWPRCRDLAWYANVPHKELTVEKAVQNWIRFEGDRFRFPGGGTMFPNGADAYIDDIAKLIHLNAGSIRTAIDTGCGVASWGGYLMSRNIITMSFAPRDSHEAQVQFALERGVPAMIGVMASKRLPYPSRAFDMAHCSRCLIPWDQYGGLFLIEVDRILRPGGYWILSGPPIRWKKYWKGWERTKDDLNGEQNRIEKVAESLCWSKLVEKDDIVIWRKPINHLNCKTNHKLLSTPPSFCASHNLPDQAWYTNLETCLTRLPQVSDKDEIAGGELARWPERLNSVPPRISTGTVKGVTAESFHQDSELWRKRLVYYKTVNDQLGQGSGRYRNILDMNANLGGFAAALADDPLWVMNVVPVEAEVNTLGVIYERGLIGTYQNWCEAMSTYPRTYDFIHADSVFTLYQNRCEMDEILLEMERILRPEGGVVFRDDVDMILKIKRVTDGLNWDSRIVDNEDGPLHREKLLFAVKLYWAAPAPAPPNSTL